MNAKIVQPIRNAWDRPRKSQFSFPIVTCLYVFVFLILNGVFLAEYKKTKNETQAVKRVYHALQKANVGFLVPILRAFGPTVFIKEKFNVLGILCLIICSCFVIELCLGHMALLLCIIIGGASRAFLKDVFKLQVTTPGDTTVESDYTTEGNCCGSGIYTVLIGVAIVTLSTSFMGGSKKQNRVVVFIFFLILMAIWGGYTKVDHDMFANSECKNYQYLHGCKRLFQFGKFFWHSQMFGYGVAIGLLLNAKRLKRL